VSTAACALPPVCVLCMRPITREEAATRGATVDMARTRFRAIEGRAHAGCFRLVKADVLIALESLNDEGPEALTRPEAH